MPRDTVPESEDAPAPRKRRPILRFFQITLAILVVVLIVAWLQREEIARDFITDTLDDYGIEATYEIESIDPGRQVLTNLVIGDPAAPDLTVERAEIRITPRMGLPGVSTLVLVKPRLWGRIVDGEPSFGALDPLIFTDSTEPFEFPNMELVVSDGRALIEGDYGPIALRLDGSGHLRGGFAGELAAVAPALALPGCAANDATLFGELAITSERPQFSGPVRFASLECEDAGVSVADAGIQLDMRVDRNLADLEGTAGIQLGRAALGETSFAAMQGEGRYTWRDGDLTSDFQLQGRDFSSAAATMALVEVDGLLRATDGFARMELETDLSGRNLRPGPAMDEGLGSAIAASEGTLAAPLLQRLRQQLAAELPGSEFAATLTARQEEGRASLVVPEARLRGRSGQSLLMLSRGQLAFGESGLPYFSGNFATGGQGLPDISGRMEQDEGGALEMRLRMREYVAGTSRLAIPELDLRQAGNGSLTLDGSVEASGPLPGGFVQDLRVPVAGSVAADGSLVMWRQCMPLRFSSLEVSGLAMQGQSLNLCPPQGSPILRYDSSGLAVAATLPALKIDARLEESPLTITTGEVAFSWPGGLAVTNADVVLGEQGSAVRIAMDALAATLGEEIIGSFAGAKAAMDVVPLDITRANGTWSYNEGVLALDEVAFTMSDREEDPRFDPLVANRARLRMADGAITANATLDEPRSGRAVAVVDIVHDLASGVGRANLLVPGIRFDDKLQVAPEDCATRMLPGYVPNNRRAPGLTCLMHGTIALAEGSISGRGRIDWTPDAVTSSGRFTSEGFDFAAAFGPVRGARGTIEFSDLLGMTTPPGQRIHVDAINPGVEVYDGELAISLTDGSYLALEEARWPFMGGELTMRPVTLAVGVEERRTYELVIAGLEAQRFIDHMELNNIGATGVFDGTIPVVFDEMGNGSLEGGVLASRPPGGSVSYIGELTYEDLSPIANYAFDALRALEYDQMRIELNGSLTGDLITSVRFDGVRQGEGAQSNIVTRRLAKLPIRFVVNVRAPFYSMMNDLRSLYDPSAVRDPRGLGLLSDDGTRFVPAERPDAPPQPETDTSALRANEPDIQPSESEAMP